MENSQCVWYCMMLYDCLGWIGDVVVVVQSPSHANSSRPHVLQYARPPCLSLSSGIGPGSYSLHWWYHLATSSFSTLFSFYSQSFPASGTFPVSLLFTSGDRNTGASASGSVLPVNIQGWLPQRLTGLISLLSKGLSEVFSSTTFRRHQFLGVLLSFRSVQLSQEYPTTRKTIALTIWTFVGRVTSLLFNTLSRFVLIFLPKSNHLLIS